MYKRLVYRMMSIGIITTGAEINGNKYWHFKKGEWIRNNIMQENGVLIQYTSGITEVRYNSYYNSINTNNL